MVCHEAGWFNELPKWQNSPSVPGSNKFSPGTHTHKRVLADLNPEAGSTAATNTDWCSCCKPLRV